MEHRRRTRGPEERQHTQGTALQKRAHILRQPSVSHSRANIIIHIQREDTRGATLLIDADHYSHITEPYSTEQEIWKRAKSLAYIETFIRQMVLVSSAENTTTNEVAESTSRELEDKLRDLLDRQCQPTSWDSISQQRESMLTSQEVMGRVLNRNVDHRINSDTHLIVALGSNGDRLTCLLQKAWHALSRSLADPLIACFEIKSVPARTAVAAAGSQHCALRQIQLSKLLDNELWGAEKRELLEHISVCKKCSTDMESMEKLQSDVKRWSHEDTCVKMPPGLDKKIYNRLIEKGLIGNRKRYPNHADEVCGVVVYNDSGSLGSGLVSMDNENSQQPTILFWRQTASSQVHPRRWPS